MENYSYNPPTYTVSANVNSVMKGVYMRMTFGLIVTALVSMFAATQGFMQIMIANPFMYWGLFIGQIVIVIALSARLTKMSSMTAAGLFYLLAVLYGLSLTPIFLIYTGASIAKTFFICAGTFGAMSVYGYTTKNDLSRMGSFLFMALIGLVVASIVNVFLASSTAQWIISFGGVAIFIGLTAWDTQQIKQMAQQMPESASSHLATLGALSLYLDFINLFLYLLRFFGNSRD